MGPDVSRAGSRHGGEHRGDAARRLRSAALPDLLTAVADALAEHREEIDALNVFPVPDGDTGSNLSATAAEAASAARRAAAQRPGPAAVEAALRAARGNSGVIYSQVVAALVEVIDADGSDADVDVLAVALERADAYARRAVADPVEGTILTVLRAAGECAREQADGGADLVTALEEVLAVAQRAVTRTEHQLDVLERAGVVDAGGRGLAVALAAVLGWARHTPPPRLDTVSIPRCLFVGAEDDAPWEVQYVVATADVESASSTADRLRSDLAEIGTSVVVVSAGGLVSAHVHTDDSDAAVAAATGLGELSDLQVTDLRADNGRAPARGGDSAEAPVQPRAARATVAVVPAGGLADLVAGAGGQVVTGAAGNLPPAGAIADAIGAAAADRVVVLPGHSNAIPACRQAATLAATEHRCVVEVLDVVDHPLRVLAVISLGEDVDDAQRSDVARACRVGDVVRAERDGAIGDVQVANGQWVALADGHAVAAVDDDLGALRRLLDHLVRDGTELVTIAAGAGVDATALASVAELAADVAPDAELELLATGQRPVRFLVAVE